MEATTLIDLLNEARFYWLPALDLILLWLVIREAQGLLRRQP
jgi:hypothetical protein